MEYAYVAYTADKKLIKGKVTATNEEAASALLSYGNYQVLSLKAVVPLLNMEGLAARFSQVKPIEIMLFSRQLALLLESGTDIVGALDLLRSQITNRTLRTAVGEIVYDIRSGSSLSVALSKHPRAFSQMYCQAIAAGEQGGNLEVVLRQMADHLERGITTAKKIKNALTYPIIVVMVAIVVISLLVTFVMPTFVELYSSFKTELPLATRLLIGAADWLSQYGLYLLLAIAGVVVVGYIYTRTPTGRYQWDKLQLRMPVVGRINLLGELSRTCRTMALLLRVGLPLPQIMAMAVNGSSNKVMVEALTGVQQELIRGEGLSRPMAKREVFLPLMVQMATVGEETGSLDNTLTTVAQSYEIEADDKTSRAVGLIQPALTIFIGILVAFVAVALLSAMYSIYGQVT